jgi:hypothetical protein
MMAYYSSHKEKQNPVIFRKIEGTGGYDAESNKSETEKTTITCFLSYAETNNLKIEEGPLGAGKGDR